MSSSGRVPTLSSADAREVDRLSSERFGIPVAWLMEAAGWQVARLCRGQSIVVAAGHGNNGGDGLAAARHLHRWGRLRRVCCTDRARLKGAAAEEAQALEALGVAIEPELRLEAADVVVDALLGTGLTRPPVGRHAEWIATIVASGLPVVAIDLPSGLDSDTGESFEPCITAAITVTLALPKPGLLTPRGREMAGKTWVADIGIPSEAYRTAAMDVPETLFAESDRFELTSA